MSSRGEKRPLKRALLPPETCPPTDELRQKSKLYISSLTKAEIAAIESAFPVTNKPHSTPTSSMSQMVDRGSFDDETREKYCPERNPNFFSGPHFYMVDKIYVKLSWLDWADQNFVFWMKDNSTQYSMIGPSYMKISAFELDDFVRAIENILIEIKNTVNPALIPSLRDSDAALFDPKDEEFWDSRFTYTSPSGSLKIRPQRKQLGAYVFRLWQPKPSQSFVNREWKGPMMTMPRTTMTEFLGKLQEFQKIIHQKPVEEGESKDSSGDDIPDPESDPNSDIEELIDKHFSQKKEEEKGEVAVASSFPTRRRPKDSDPSYKPSNLKKK